MDNASVITMFTLSGLNDIANYRVTLFSLTLLCYCMIWLVNLTIIVTVIFDTNLHEPMYIFLCNMCINSLYGTLGFYPKFLIDLLSATHVISYAGCFLQAFVLHSSVTADVSILVLMSYDRYVAICRPLVYRLVMTRQRISVLIFVSWLLPFCLMLISTISTLTLRLCGSHIPKIYCVNFLIGNLACSKSIANKVIPAFNYSFYLSHVIFVTWSYMKLIRMCRASRKNRSKFMQTCLPHFLCLIIFVTCLLFDFVYTRFGSKHLSQGLQHFMAMEYLLIPPLFNPLIYGLILTKIRIRIHSVLCRKHAFI
ncbi:olfactory receptor 4P4-like [Brachionichthys hirsutus]|uniref:olfactory receptor 4P4-like n=1 Tax=Brachionichthys hirsutus TaxID=412623 RepID=UPI00360482BF